MMLSAAVSSDLSSEPGVRLTSAWMRDLTEQACHAATFRTTTSEDHAALGLLAPCQSTGVVGAWDTYSKLNPPTYIMSHYCNTKEYWYKSEQVQSVHANTEPQGQDLIKKAKEQIVMQVLGRAADLHRTHFMQVTPLDSYQMEMIFSHCRPGGPPAFKPAISRCTELPPTAAKRGLFDRYFASLLPERESSSSNGKIQGFRYRSLTRGIHPPPRQQWLPIYCTIRTKGGVNVQEQREQNEEESMVWT
ncbi:UNVERIFIED_CONTAM: hypothetical protein FKN15_067550 [Acipenser sinensis]